MTAFGLGYSSVPQGLRYAAPPGAPAPAAAPQAAPQADKAGNADGNPGQFLGRILTYIPGDVVGLYLVATGFVPNDYYKTGAWVIFGILIPGSALAVFSGYRVGMRQKKSKSEPVPWVRMVAAPVAFVVWAISLPKSPFDPIWILGMGWMKSIILAVGTFLIVVIADIFDSD